MMLSSDKMNVTAQHLYERVRDLPIVSPHGHCDPSWWANDTPFSDPATLLIVPDHYVFRMLYSQGVSLNDLGIGVPQEQRDARAIFQLFADHWHCFLGTPSREWMEFTLHKTLGIQKELSPVTANDVFDEIAEKLKEPSFRPRALFDSFNIEVLATTDAANDDLRHHQTIKASGWNGRVIPTFRPDSVLNPSRKDHQAELTKLGEITNKDITNYSEFLEALKLRRAYFVAHGATATDHDVPELATIWLEPHEIEVLHKRAVKGELSKVEATTYYGHMLIEMAQMSVEDGLVMQLHAGSYRNTNDSIFKAYGPDMGADMPRAVNWVEGLNNLLNRVGNEPDLRVLLFTLDETSYSKELAPLAGHWPCLRVGPPWWFHDTTNGMKRYFDQIVETAGYFNLAGFNDDTRAFLSIPARHDTWRRSVSIHLAEQVECGRFKVADAEMLAGKLCRDLALEAYGLQKRDS